MSDVVVVRPNRKPPWLATSFEERAARDRQIAIDMELAYARLVPKLGSQRAQRIAMFVALGFDGWSNEDAWDIVDHVLPRQQS